jgi:uncharacterized membrane protein YedE/YeeE
MSEPVKTLLLGALLGFTLSNIGFSSWDEVHAMFVFADLRLLLTFVVAVVAVAALWWTFGVRRGVRVQSRPVHRGTVPGAALFGAGWALAGACPSIALVQLGEGQLGAVLTLVGMIAGNWIYAVVQPRVFRWSQGSCADG